MESISKETSRLGLKVNEIESLCDIADGIKDTDKPKLLIFLNSLSISDSNNEISKTIEKLIDSCKENNNLINDLENKLSTKTSELSKLVEDLKKILESKKQPENTGKES